MADRDVMHPGGQSDRPGSSRISGKSTVLIPIDHELTIDIENDPIIAIAGKGISPCCCDLDLALEKRGDLV